MPRKRLAPGAFGFDKGMNSPASTDFPSLCLKNVRLAYRVHAKLPEVFSGAVVCCSPTPNDIANGGASMSWRRTISQQHHYTTTSGEDNSRVLFEAHHVITLLHRRIIGSAKEYFTTTAVKWLYNGKQWSDFPTLTLPPHFGEIGERNHVYSQLIRSHRVVLVWKL